MVPNVGIDDNSINVNETRVTLTLSWGEPFNNFATITSYIVSCSGDVTCPRSFTITDNTIRSHTFTNLATMTTYTFSVVAANSIGRGEAGRAMITTPGDVHKMFTLMYICKSVMVIYVFFSIKVGLIRINVWAQINIGVQHTK